VIFLFGCSALAYSSAYLRSPGYVLHTVSCPTNIAGGLGMGTAYLFCVALRAYDAERAVIPSVIVSRNMRYGHSAICMHEVQYQVPNIL
jgi:hypothetical protein